MAVERWKEPGIIVPHHSVFFNQLGISIDFGPTVALGDRPINELMGTDNALLRMQDSRRSETTELDSSISTNTRREEILALAAVMVEVTPNYDNEGFNNVTKNCMHFAGDAMNAANNIINYDRVRNGQASMDVRQLGEISRNMDIDAIYNLADQLERTPNIEQYLNNNFFNRFENGMHNRGQQSSTELEGNALYAELLNEYSIETQNYAPAAADISNVTPGSSVAQSPEAEYSRSA